MRRIQPPQTWGELFAAIGLLGSLAAYLYHEHERVAALEAQIAERPVLMERRDRETDSVHEDVRELRNKLLCPCHD
jgi:hypothetical protein